MPLALYIKVETHGDAVRERKERMIDGQPCVCARPERIKNIKRRQRERANKTLAALSLRSERAEKKVINYFYTFFHLSLTGVRNKLRWKVKSFLPLSFLCWLPHNGGGVGSSTLVAKLTPKELPTLQSNAIPQNTGRCRLNQAPCDFTTLIVLCKSLFDYI